MNIKTKRERMFNLLLIILVTLFILSFIVLPLINKSSHWYVVTSGSMQSTLKIGDIVYVSKASVNEVKIGDIINFYQGEKEYTITHRCIDIIERENKTFFKTKGDANEDNDTFLTPQDALIGKIPYVKIFGHIVYAKIPRLGYLSYFVHTKIGFFLLILLPGYTIIGLETYNILSILQGKSKEEEKKIIHCPKCKGEFYCENIRRGDKIKCGKNGE